MKQHIFSKGGLLLAFMLLVLGFFACREDLQEGLIKTSDVALSAEIQAAKSWFDNYQKQSSLPESSKFKKMTPVWSKAITVHNAVEVPFTIDGKFYLPSLDQTKKHMGRRKLVIYDNGSRGRAGYVVDYMPAETFTGKIKDINSINFRQLKFTGMVDLYNLNHVNLGRFMYKKGKFVQRYYEDTSSSSGKEDGNCTTTVVVECDLNSDPIVCYDVFQLTCKKPTPNEDPCDGPNPPSNCNEDPCAGPNPPPNCSGDPCDGPNPPPSCGNGDPCAGQDPPPNCSDPCSGPNPPPNCDGGGGDCNGQPCDPCVLNPTLPECKKCESTGAKNFTTTVGIFNFFPFGWIDFTGRMSIPDLESGNYTLGSPLQHTLRVPVPCAVNFASEGSWEYVNELDKSTCTRKIGIDYWGDITVVLQTEYMDYVVGYTSTRQYAYSYLWTFS